MAFLYGFFAGFLRGLTFSLAGACLSLSSHWVSAALAHMAHYHWHVADSSLE